jgi:transcriptional regulator with XRE-family HTH domain
MGSQMKSDADALAAAIGARVRSQRQMYDWTLDELAQRSGVSRRMLVNVEQGTTNPSIATLLRLSDSLGIGLPALVDAGTGQAMRVRRSTEMTPMWTSPSGGRALMVAGTQAPDVVELWDWTLGPGDIHTSEPHVRGTRELIAVLQGSLRLRVGDREELLKAGDSATFDADTDHAYLNPSKQRKTRFALTVFEPGVGKEHS